MLGIFNSEKKSNFFLEFSKVADLEIGGFKNLDEQNLVFNSCKIQIKRSTSLISDVFYIIRENHYKVSGGDPRVFSFFGQLHSKICVPDGKYSQEPVTMKLNTKGLLSYKEDFFTYDLTQKISLSNAVYKVKNIRLITNLNIAYLIYPNGMGRIYKN